MNTCATSVNMLLRSFSPLVMQLSRIVQSVMAKLERYITTLESYLREVDFIKLIQEVLLLPKPKVSLRANLRISLKIKRIKNDGAAYLP